MDAPNFEQLLEIIYKPPEQRNDKDLETLKNALQHIEFLVKLHDENIEIYTRCLMHVRHEYMREGQTVFEIGSIGEKFYIILKGAVSVNIKYMKYVNDDYAVGDTLAITEDEKKEEYYKAAEPASGEEKHHNSARALQKVAVLESGKSFGEMALINNRPRLATIVCEKNTHFGVIVKKNFDEILKYHYEYYYLAYLSFLSTKHAFSNWNLVQLKGLYLNSSECRFRYGETVFEEGYAADHVYVIKKGDFYACKFMKNDYYEECATLIASESLPLPKRCKVLYYKPQRMKLCILAPTDLVGEEDLMYRRTRTFSVLCFSGEGVLLRIARKDFRERVLSDSWTLQTIQARLQLKEARLQKRLYELQAQIALYPNLYFNSYVDVRLHKDHYFEQFHVPLTVYDKPLLEYFYSPYTQSLEDREYAARTDSTTPQEPKVVRARDFDLIAQLNTVEIQTPFTKKVEDNDRTKNKKQSPKKAAPPKPVVLKADSAPKRPQTAKSKYSEKKDFFFASRTAAYQRKRYIQDFKKAYNISIKHTTFNTEEDNTAVRFNSEYDRPAVQKPLSYHTEENAPGLGDGAATRAVATTQASVPDSDGGAYIFRNTRAKRPYTAYQQGTIKYSTKANDSELAYSNFKRAYTYSSLAPGDESSRLLFAYQQVPESTTTQILKKHIQMREGNYYTYTYTFLAIDDPLEYQTYKRQLLKRLKTSPELSVAKITRRTHSSKLPIEYQGSNTLIASFHEKIKSEFYHKFRYDSINVDSLKKHIDTDIVQRIPDEPTPRLTDKLKNEVPRLNMSEEKRLVLYIMSRSGGSGASKQVDGTPTAMQYRSLSGHDNESDVYFLKNMISTNSPTNRNSSAFNLPYSTFSASLQRSSTPVSREYVTYSDNSKANKKKTKLITELSKFNSFSRYYSDTRSTTHLQLSYMAKYRELYKFERENYKTGFERLFYKGRLDASKLKQM